MAQQLLNPGILDEGLRSGLFISGLRRTGKTTFLIADLVPALEEKGAIVIYVDLWSDTLTQPSALLHKAIGEKLAQLETPASGILERLSKINGLDLGGFGFKFGFKLQDLGREGGVTLAQALREIVDKARTDLVLIVDEVQQATASDDGHNMMLALKAARDSINPRPGTAGHLIFIGTGSHRAQLSEMTAKRNQAFAGATSISYPVLDEGYVDFLMALYGAEVDAQRLPSAEVTMQAFRALGNRPEELKRALGQVVRQGGDPNMVMPIVAQTLRSTVADGEILKVEKLGNLAVEIFGRIAGSDGPVSRLFSVEAAGDYTKAIGRDVRVEEIQPVINALLAENLIMRVGHGSYTLSDPYVGEMWKENLALLAGAK
ncbi:ATP-binding protein [Pseudomonas fluorescens]|nr:ATP-binding protein [Pseudomonas fluorescens]